MTPEQILFTIFGIIIVGFLVADLGYFNRQAHKISLRSAAYQSLFWIAIALGFSGLVFKMLGAEAGTQFLSAYVTEKMLSVDNLFVILLLFSYFKLEEKYHHRVLFWGILGAIVFRGAFILTGSYIISQFHWVLYIFGAILVYTGFKLLSDKQEEHADFSHSHVYKAAHKLLRFTQNHHGGHFFVRENGKWYATLLFMIVILVETTDIIFAIDSIPAAFSISQNAFIVFTSNIFAVMGLRALFFLIEGIMHRFHHLQKGLAFILVFIGAKMLAVMFGVHLSSILSFAIIMGALALSLMMSVLYPKKL